MDDTVQPEAAAGMTERLRSNRFLSSFMSPALTLSQPGERDFGRAFERLAAMIGGSPVRARINFGIVDGEATQSWSLDLGSDGCQVSSGRAHRPDLEFLIQEPTWWQIAEGRLTLLEAFLGRGMRVRGDIGVARRFIRLLQQG